MVVFFFPFYFFFHFLKFCDGFSRLMLLEENQIAFHSEDGLIFDGVKDYSRQLAEMIGLGSDTELSQAGVSLPYTIIHQLLFSGEPLCFTVTGFVQNSSMYSTVRKIMLFSCLYSH